MLKITTTQLWVNDQDEALAFWTEKVGMEVRSDVTVPELGNFRWLTVAPVGQEDVAIVLMAIPGQPVMDDATQEQVRALMGRGFAGTVFLTTDDCRRDYEEMKARGVEFVDAPDDLPHLHPHRIPLTCRELCRHVPVSGDPHAVLGEVEVVEAGAVIDPIAGTGGGVGRRHGALLAEVRRGGVPTDMPPSIGSTTPVM